MALLTIGDPHLSLVHSFVGYDVEEEHRIPLDYWKLSFPSQMLPDVIS